MQDREMKSLFIQGLLVSIRALVRTYSGNHPEKTYTDIVRYASGQGDAQRGHRKLRPIPPEGAALRERRPKRDVQREVKTRAAFAVEDSTSSLDTDASDTDTSDPEADAFALSSDKSVTFPTTQSTTTQGTTPVPALPVQPPTTTVGYYTRRNDAKRTDGTYRRCWICRAPSRPCCAHMFTPEVRETLLKRRELQYQLDQSLKTGQPGRSLPPPRKGVTPTWRMHQPQALAVDPTPPAPHEEPGKERGQ